MHINCSSLTRRETGITLVELLVAMTLLATVFAIAVPALVTALTSQPRISAKSGQVSTGRAVIERMVRELRQGYAIDSAGSGALSFRTYVRRSTCGGDAVPSATTPAILCQVTYTCTDGACSRAEGPPGSSGGTQAVLVEGLSEGPVFTYLPDAADPTYVEIRLSFLNADGDESITLDDGIDLRNIRS